LPSILAIQPIWTTAAADPNNGETASKYSFDIPNELSIPQSMATGSLQNTYHLSGIICHMPHHYTSIIRYNAEWYEIDDARTKCRDSTQVAFEDSRIPVLLVYVRMDDSTDVLPSRGINANQPPQPRDRGISSQPQRKSRPGIDEQGAQLSLDQADAIDGILNLSLRKLPQATSTLSAARAEKWFHAQTEIMKRLKSLKPPANVKILPLIQCVEGSALPSSTVHPLLERLSSSRSSIFVFGQQSSLSVQSVKERWLPSDGWLSNHDIQDSIIWTEELINLRHQIRDAHILKDRWRTRYQPWSDVLLPWIPHTPKSHSLAKTEITFTNIAWENHHLFLAVYAKSKMAVIYNSLPTSDELFTVSLIRGERSD